MPPTRWRATPTGTNGATGEAALWCFLRDGSVLLAANLGDDADTTAAIAGQLAGAFYGEPGIPADWLATLYQATEIAALAESLLACQQARQRSVSS